MRISSAPSGDRNVVPEALALLCEIAGGDFAALDKAKADAAATALLSREVR